MESLFKQSEIYKRIFENNKKWVQQKTENDKGFFERLSEGQEPEVLYIGCSDSRVPANDVMGMEPGEVFVHRNVANLVVNTDLNAAAVINYAVVHLKVKEIVVCGHYNCGGVKAAMSSQDLGILNPWLRNIRDVYRLHQNELDTISDEGKRYDRLVELNVQEQCINVIKMAEVQEAYADRGFPVVHGWVLDLRNGYIKDLDIDFAGILKQIQKIYNITEKKWSILSCGGANNK